MFSLPGWPGGDPGKISSAAKAWNDLSTALAPVFATCDSTITGLEVSWSGEAQAKFNAVWSDFHKLYGESVTGTKETSESLDKVSEKLNDAHAEYTHTILITTAAITAALALSWCTFGVSDVAAGGIASTGIAVIDGICTVLGDAIADLAGSWIAPELLANIIVGGGISFIDNVGEQSADSIWNEKHWSVNWWDAGEAGAFGAAGGGIGGKFGDIDNLAGKLAFNSGLGFASGMAQQGINVAEGQGFDLNKVIASTVEEGLTGGLEHAHETGGGTHEAGHDSTGHIEHNESDGGTQEGGSTDSGTQDSGSTDDSSGSSHGGGGRHEANVPPDSGTATTGGGRHEASTPPDPPSPVGTGGRHRAE